MGKSPTALPSFAHTWLGGDPHALSAFAGTLYGYVDPVSGVKTALDGKVDAVVGDAGWYGDAASAFKSAWSKDSLAAQVLVDVLGQAGDAVDDLAFALATYEHTLEAQAEVAAQAGVKIGPDGGSIPAMGPFTPDELPDAQKAAAAGSTYENVRSYLIDEAHNARLAAGQLLQGLTTKIVPEDGEGLSKGDDVVVADFIRGLYAIPSAYKKAAEDALATAESERDKAKAAWTAARDATPAGQKMPEDVKAALRAAKGDVAAAEARLDSAVAGESKLPGSAILDLRLSDAAKALGVAGSDGLETGSRVSKFLGDIPVLDALAVVGGTYFGSESDMQKGESAGTAIAENATANVLAVGAGAAAGTAVAGLAGGAAIAGAPVLAVAAGAAAGGLVAVGVGDLATNAFHEDWSTDIHNHGVLGGLAHGAGDVLSNTGHDLGKMADGVGDAAKSVWHGLFG